MSKKTYISINSPCLITTVKVDGRDTVVRFCRTHGSVACGRGVFATDDGALQLALESDSSYGIDYRLCTEESDALPVAASGDSYTDIEEVHNRQTAIEWAASALSLELPVRMTGEKIRSELARRGYRFPRWTERSVAK